MPGFEDFGGPVFERGKANLLRLFPLRQGVLFCRYSLS